MERTMMLTRMQERTHATIASLAKDGRRDKLISLGILPGLKVTLLQSWPAYVIAISHSRYVLDEELASAIHVIPETDTKQNH